MMKFFSLLLVLLSLSAAHADSAMNGNGLDAPSEAEMAYLANCKVVGQHVAMRQAGQLKSSQSMLQKNGRRMCIVVVIVPGLNGEKSRRVEVGVPEN